MKNKTQIIKQHTRTWQQQQQLLRKTLKNNSNAISKNQRRQQSNGLMKKKIIHQSKFKIKKNKTNKSLSIQRNDG